MGRGDRERRKSKSGSRDRKRDDRKSRRSRSRERSSRDSRRRGRDNDYSLSTFPPPLPGLSSFMPYMPITPVAPRPSWGRVLPGDWPCPRCGYHNFAGNQCNASKHGDFNPFAPQGRDDGPAPFLTTNLQRDSRRDLDRRFADPVDISIPTSEENGVVELSSSKSWGEHECRSSFLNSWVIQRSTHVLWKPQNGDTDSTLGSLCGRCLVLDLTAFKQVTLDDFLPFGDLLNEKDIVLIKTTNSKLGVRDLWSTDIEPVELSQEVATLVCDKKVRAVGFDGVTVGESSSRVFLERGVPLILGLRLSDVTGATSSKSSQGRCALVCLPLAVQAEAVPARAVIFSTEEKKEARSHSRGRDKEERKSREKERGRASKSKSKSKSKDRSPTKKSKERSPHRSRSRSGQRSRSPSPSQ